MVIQRTLRYTKLSCVIFATALTLGDGQRNETQKQIETNQSANSCSLCGRLGVEVLDKVFPGEFYTYQYRGPCNDIDLMYASDVAPENCHISPEIESFCCDQSELLPTYECEQRVRDQILDSEDVTYSTAVAPVDTTTRTVEVETFIEYYYLSKLDITSSSLEFYALVQQKWKDPRLAWAITNETCVTSITVRASADPEKTDIWVPDFDLYNKERGVIDFPDAVATVYSDGTVKWNRSGFITAMCVFVGLRKMPYDELGCQLLFGGHNKKVRYVLREWTDLETNVTKKGFGFLSGIDQAYTEYKIMPERSNCDYYKDTYPSDFHVELFFKRASRHYVQFILFPNILFVFLSFGQFFLHIGSTERLSFGLTVVLIMVTQSVVVSSLLPLCEESLWINTMSLYSTGFTVISLKITLAWFGIDKFFTRKEKDDEEEKLKKNEESEVDDNLDVHESVPLSPPGKLRLFTIFSSRFHSSKTSRDLIEIIDDVCVALLMIAYVLFLIIMYATLDNYGDKMDEDGNYVSFWY